MNSHPRRIKMHSLCGSPNDLGAKASEEQVPAMPVCQMNPQNHRVKCVLDSACNLVKGLSTLVARPVGKKEIRANPKAQQALDIEWEKLVKKTLGDMKPYQNGRPSPRRRRSLGRKFMWVGC